LDVDACRSITDGCQGFRVIFVSLPVSSPTLLVNVIIVLEMFMPIIRMKSEILGIKKWTFFTIQLLFVVVMKALSRVVLATVNMCLLFGFSVESRNDTKLVVSHLLFADDTLIFCEANCEHLRNFQCLFFLPRSSIKVKDKFIKIKDNSSW
jgi:hypothetical protein